MKISQIPYNVSYIKLRDNRDLICPSRIIVILTSLIIKIFETFIESDIMINEYYLASSLSSVILTTLKEIIHAIISKSYVFNTFHRKYNHYNKSMKSSYIRHFVNTIFNTITNNFTIILNRRDVVKN